MKTWFRGPVDMNDPQAPWNIVYEAAALDARLDLVEVADYAIIVPAAAWNHYGSPPAFPRGLVDRLADLVTNGARIAFTADTQHGKSTLQFALHERLYVESVLAVHSTGHNGSLDLGMTTTYRSDEAPTKLPDAFKVASWYELLACGHLCHLMRDEDVISPAPVSGRSCAGGSKAGAARSRLRCPRAQLRTPSSTSATAFRSPPRC